MKIKIYQINKERDKRNLCFMGYDFWKKHGHADIDSKIYDLVYEGKVEQSDLEGVYAMFNIDHPSDYRGRSLSTSDIVEVCENSKKVKQGFYFVDNVGFKRVDFAPQKRLKVVLIRPGEKPEITDIDGSLSEMQKVVGGSFEATYPYIDQVCIICNEEGKLQNLPLNRAMRVDTRKNMTYGQMAKLFRAHEANKPDYHLTGYIVFTEDSFSKPYDLRSRTYEVSSNNKAYQPNMGGYSILGSCLDGTDQNLRLEAYMAAEKGGENGWKVEECYMFKPGEEIADVICGTFFIVGMGEEGLISLTPEQARFYADRYKYPEAFVRAGKQTIVVPIINDK